MNADVSLRPVAERDLSLLARPLLSERDAGPFNWYGQRDTSGFAARLARDGFLDDRQGRLVVTDRDGGVGTVSWTASTHGPMSGPFAWTIGIWIAPEARGAGVGTSAQRLLVDHLLATTPVHRIEADTDVENIVERRALQRVGFRFEGVIRGAQHRADGWHDLALYGRLRTDD